MDKVKLFEKELELIENHRIKKFATLAVESIPDYFFTVPASSTGKYHPSYALGEGGLLRHTKAAVMIAQELLQLEMFPYNRDIKDLAIVALILHDSQKHGSDHSKYTLATHPTLAKSSILSNPKINTILMDDEMEILCACIETHMGQFNQDYKTKKEILPKPKKGVENFVHLCDYLASRKILEVNFNL